MIDIGIGIAKDKHDYFMMNSDVENLSGVFIIRNNRDGFDELFSKIKSVSTYKSGKVYSIYAKMEKCGSTLF